MSATDLSALARSGGHTAAHVARPKSRFLSRVVVPAVILLSVLGLLAYTARESLRPALPVQVVAAVLVPVGAGGAAPASFGEVVQAPGWIEPDPSAVGVQALAPGVLKELPVLDGQRVKAGEVVAVLVDEDALLASRRAEAELARASAAVVESRAAVIVEEARAEEARDASRRVEGLAGTGVIAEGEITGRRLKLASQVAAIGTAKSAVARVEAEERAAQVALDEARLALDRMRVRAPVDGVVLQRMVEPGQRLMPDANNPFAGVVVRLYDPAHLQVRVDIPLADAAKVRTGDPAEVSTEALPGRTFAGTVTRFVHEANLQKNTVQVKVSIADPAPELKPDMLAKVRVTTRAPDSPEQSISGGAASGSLVVARADALQDVAGERAWVWIVDRETSTVVKRSLRLRRVTPAGAEVMEGLRPGDRVVVRPPPGLREGAKVSPAELQEDR